MSNYMEIVKSNTHKLGLPYYQIKNGYIIAVYPDNLIKVLQKA